MSSTFVVFEDYLKGKGDFGPADIEQMREASFVKKLYKKQYLLQEGDVWRFDAFVAKGCVRTYARDEKGQDHVINFAIENWWTGDRESLLSGQPARLNIDAIEDSEIILWPHGNFEKLCVGIPAFGALVHSIINRSFVASQKRIETALTLTAEQKYADYLQRYPQIVSRVPQAMLASYLGMTPETLSRVRNLLARK